MATKKAADTKKKAKPSTKSEPSEATIEKNLDGITQAGLLMACADGELEENEVGALAAILCEALADMGVELTEEVFVGKVEQLMKQFEGKELPEMLALIKGNITERDAAEAALAVAAVVMVSDEEFDEDAEAPLYAALGEALGFSEEEYVAVLEETLGGDDEDGDEEDEDELQQRLMPPPSPDALASAISAREVSLAPPHNTAVRLYNGFTEGGGPVVDLYGATLLIDDHDSGGEAAARAILGALLPRLPWVKAALWKARRGATPEERNGRLLLGSEADLDRSVSENGVSYAIDLRLNRDASFYLDTRNLRAWAKANLAGKSVLNTFAYTGSLGVAARAAPASRVVHVDRSAAFLDVARASYRLNSFPVRRVDFLSQDFFEAAARFKKQEILFDCVFVDPPFFSSTDKGRVDQQAEATRLLNKVRPLIGDGGWLVSVNNALFLPGAEHARSLQALCADGYLSVETTVPVPADVVGPSPAPAGVFPSDPAPYNHPTKITILRVRRKDGRRASVAG